MDRLQSMRVFREVVDEGGFAAAARKLELAPAAVTRLVSDLEKHLGVRLLQRTTRRLSLTPAGEAYLARLRGILTDIDEADAVVQAQSREMSGTVRILAQPAVAMHALAPAVPEFQRLHPDIVLELHVHDVVDPNVEDYDLTIVNDTVPLVSSAIVRPVVESLAVLCASPDYLRRFGEPRAPEDLRSHRCLRLRAEGTRLRALTLIDPTAGDRRIEVDAPAVMVANHADSLLRATVAGGGVGIHAAALIAPLLQAGTLQRVLAPWITGRVRLVAAMPSRKYTPARTRAFLDFLVDYTRTGLAGLDVAAEQA